MSIPLKVRSAGIFLALLSLSITTSSCQKKIEEVIVEKAFEQSTGKKVDIKAGGKNITVESDGQKIQIQGNSGVWPADIPADVPMFSYGTIKGVTRFESREGKSWSVVCENVSGNIVKNYESKLKKNGFETVSTIVTSDKGEEGSVSGTKEKMNVMLMIGNGSASLSVVKEP
ncbi:MAG: hypothetical protein HGA59_03700 [Chlorobiaceae bacterium]|nr:hypothetical protein [Chlorobiaceae bacterium]NTV16432.1 hypothetical protein [Chlorobiaceae bacterium]